MEIRTEEHGGSFWGWHGPVKDFCKNDAWAGHKGFEVGVCGGRGGGC